MIASNPRLWLIDFHHSARHKIFRFLDSHAIYYLNAFAVEVGTGLDAPDVDITLDAMIRAGHVHEKVKDNMCLYRITNHGRARFILEEEAAYERAKHC